jgi:hypothetical protein
VSTILKFGFLEKILPILGTVTKVITTLKNNIFTPKRRKNGKHWNHSIDP